MYLDLQWNFKDYLDLSRRDLYYIREGGSYGVLFWTDYFTPLPFLNYKRNLKIKMETQKKLPKINLQHSLTNHSQIT